MRYICIYIYLKYNSQWAFNTKVRADTKRKKGQKTRKRKSNKICKIYKNTHTYAESEGQRESERVGDLVQLLLLVAHMSQLATTTTTTWAFFNACNNNNNNTQRGLQSVQGSRILKMRSQRRLPPDVSNNNNAQKKQQHEQQRSTPRCISSSARLPASLPACLHTHLSACLSSYCLRLRLFPFLRKVFALFASLRQ